MMHHVNLQDDLAKVKLLLAVEKPDVNTPISPESDLPLNIALAANDLILAQKLVDAGANVNLPNKNGNTAITTAIASKNVEALKIILKAHPRPELDRVVNSDKQTILHLICQTNDNISFDQLMAITRADANINALDTNYRTPLFLAVKAGNLDIVEALLDQKARHNTEDVNGSSPLHEACKSKNPNTQEIINALIKAGANLNAADDLGKTPLHYAADLKDKAIIKMLIAAGANIDAVNKAGVTPFKDDRRIIDLQAGPRNKSQVTIDYETIVRAFISDNPPPYVKNRLGEIEVKIDGKIFNLSKILEHLPDLEHVDLSFRLDEQHVDEQAEAAQATRAEAFMRSLTEYKFVDDKNVPVDKRKNMTIYEVTMNRAFIVPKGQLQVSATSDGLECGIYAKSRRIVIPWADLPPDFPKYIAHVDEIKPYMDIITKQLATVEKGVLSEAEARAIRYYTMHENSDKAFEKINRFMREYGKIEDLEVNSSSNDLRTIMFILAYLPQAIMKLRKPGAEENQELYRGENYDTRQLAKDVLAHRTSQTITPSPGFVSTSVEKDIMKAFSHKTNPDENIKTTFVQTKDADGVNIAAWSAKPHENEVLRMHGAQVIFRHSPYGDNALIATPVRTIDEIYTNGYLNRVLDLRTQLIKYTDDYSKTANYDPALLRLMDEFSKRVCVYGPSELVDMLSACTEYEKKIGNIHIDHLNEDTINQFKSIITNVSAQVDAALMNEITSTHERIIDVAKHAYDNYLINKFTQPDVCPYDLSAEVNGVIIERPNHGLAHSVRKAMYIPVIFSTFKSHAQDQEFRDFLSTMSHEKMLLIQTAILFSVTGRESEVGADSPENTKIYMTYRQKAKDNFMQYVKAAGLYYEKTDGDEIKEQQNELIKMLAQQVKYMGNPNFYNSINGIPNKERGEEVGYRQPEKIFVYYLMNFAHGLDLLRCFKLEKFQKAISAMTDGLAKYVDTSFTDKAMPVLLDMANTSILATGDREFTTYEKGELVKADHSKSNYKKAFVACSTDAQACVKTCIVNSKVFSEVMNGMLNIDIKQKRIKFTSIQQAIINNDSKILNNIKTDASFNKTSMSTFLEELLNTLATGTTDSWNKLSLLIKTSNDIDPGDLVACLHAAVISGQLDIVEALIEKGVDNTQVNKEGMSPLHIAVRDNQIKIAELLLKNAGNINDVNNNGETPLFIAMDNMNWDIVREMLRHPDLQISFDQGGFYLEKLIEEQQYDLALQFLNLNIPIRLDRIDYNGNTFLHRAVKAREIELVKKLVERGVNINIVNYTKSSPLMLAYEYNATEISNFLLNSPNNHGDINDIDDRGMSALHYAMQHGNEDAINDLLSKNVNVNIANYNGETAIHFAVKSANPKIISLLINNKADINVQNYSHKTPISLATKRGDIDIIKLLINHPGLKFNCANNSTMDVLRIAASHKETDILDLLVSKLQLKDYRNASGNSFLQLAIIHAINTKYDEGMIKLIKYLCDLGLDPNIRYANRMTPLHYTAQNGLKEVTKILLDHGASTTALNHNQQMPMDLISRKYDEDPFLMEADRIQNEVYSSSPLVKAAVNNQWDEVDRLLDDESIDVRGDIGGCVLYCASRDCASHESIILKLLQHQTFINTEFTLDNVEWETPLMLAASQGANTIVRALLEKGADPNVDYEDDAYALSFAADNGHWDTVKLILDLANPPPCFDPICLFTAVLTRQTDLVERLVNLQGAKDDVTDGNSNDDSSDDDDINYGKKSNNNDIASGRNALRIAVDNNDIEIVRALIQCEEYNVKINQVASDGETALIAAALKNNWQMVKLLLTNYDANINVVSTSNSLTLLQMAINAGEIELVKQLSQDERLDTRLYDQHQNSALHFAALSGHADIVNALLHVNRFDANRKNKDNKTAALLAAENGHWTIVEAFMNKNNNIKFKSSSMTSILKLALNDNRHDIIRLITDKINLQKKYDKAGHTFLHYFVLLCMKHKDDTELRQILNTILERTSDINIKAISKGYTALQLAVKGNDIELVDMLLKHGADINIKSQNGETPFSIAVYRGYWNILESILNHENTHLSFSDKSTLHMLDEMIKTNRLDMIESIFAEYSPSTFRNGLGQSLLQVAIAEGKSELANYLIDMPGIDLNTIDDGTNSILHTACYYNNLSVLQKILTKLENHPDNEEAPLVNMQTQLSVSPIEVAANRNNWTLVDALMNARHIDLSNEIGGTILLKAARAGYSDIANKLLDMNIPLDLSISSDYGRTALYIAVLQNDTHLMQRLLERGADPNTPDDHGVTPLDCACINKNFAAADILLNAPGILVDGMSSQSTLHLAITTGQPNFVEALLQKNANVEAIDKYGMSPLFNAIQSKSPHAKDIIALLEKYHVNFKTSIKGMTPLFYAVEHSTKDVVEFLLQHADADDINAVNFNNCSLLTTAATKGYTNVVEFATKQGAKVDLADKHTMAAILSAASKSKWDIVQLMLDANTNPSFTGRSKLILCAAVDGKNDIISQLLKCDQTIVDDSTTSLGSSNPLRIAVANGNEALAIMLLTTNNYQANINNYTYDDPLHILHIAAKKGQTEVVRKILEHPELDVNVLSRDKCSALYYATKAHHWDIVMMLLDDKKFKLDYFKPDAMNLMLYAVNAAPPRLDVIQHLFATHPPFNVTHENGFSFLHMIIRAASDKKNANIAGFDKIIELLLKAGMNVNAKNREDITPLHLAANADLVNIAKILLEHGADMTARDKSNNTPQQRADLSKSHAVASLLDAASSDLNINQKPAETISKAPNATMFGAHAQSAGQKPKMNPAAKEDKDKDIGFGNN